jgi:gliding motility-associated-like protein
MPCAVTAELAGSDLSTCLNTSKSLGAVATTTMNLINYWVPEAGLSLLSSTNDPSAFVESSAVGTYEMIWFTEDTITMCTNSDTAFVNVSTLTAAASAGADITVCVDVSKSMAAVATSTINQINYWDPEYNLNLQSAPDNPSAMVQSAYAGVYRIVWFTEDTVTSCIISDTAYVNVTTLNPLSAGADRDTCIGSPVNLNAMTIPSLPNLTYNWDNPSNLTLGSVTSPTSSVSGNTPGSYVLVWVTTDNSTMCVAGDTMYVTISDCSEEPPVTDAPLNVFPGVSPNNDKLNDTFIIENIDLYSDNTLVIYDREGNEVFSTKSYKNDWAATNKDGKEISNGTYYFKLVYNDLENKEKRISGYIEVRR